MATELGPRRVGDVSGASGTARKNTAVYREPWDTHTDPDYDKKLKQGAVNSQAMKELGVVLNSKPGDLDALVAKYTANDAVDMDGEDKLKYLSLYNALPEDQKKKYPDPNTLDTRNSFRAGARAFADRATYGNGAEILSGIESATGPQTYKERMAENAPTYHKAVNASPVMSGVGTALAPSPIPGGSGWKAALRTAIQAGGADALTQYSDADLPGQEFEFNPIETGAAFVLGGAVDAATRVGGAGIERLAEAGTKAKPSVAQGLALKATRASPRMIENLEEKGLASDVGQYALDNGLVGFGSTPKSIYKNSQEHLAGLWPELQQTIAQLDAKAAAQGKQLSSAEVAKVFEDKAKALYPDPTTRDLAVSLYAEAKKWKNPLTFQPTLENLRKAKGNYDAKAERIFSDAQGDSLRDFSANARGLVNDKINDTARKVDPALADQLADVNSRYSKAANYNKLARGVPDADISDWVAGQTASNLVMSGGNPAALVAGMAKSGAYNTVRGGARSSLAVTAEGIRKGLSNPVSRFMVGNPASKWLRKFALNPQKYGRFAGEMLAAELQGSLPEYVAKKTESDPEFARTHRQFMEHVNESGESGADE